MAPSFSSQCGVPLHQVGGAKSEFDWKDLLIKKDGRIFLREKSVFEMDIPMGLDTGDWRERLRYALSKEWHEVNIIREMFSQREKEIEKLREELKRAV